LQEKLGELVSTVIKWCDKAGIQLRNRIGEDMPNSENFKRKKRKVLEIAGLNKTSREISEETGVPIPTVKDWCKRAGIKLKNGRGRNQITYSEEYHKKRRKAIKLKKVEKTIPEIAKEVGVAYQTAKKWTKKIKKVTKKITLEQYLNEIKCKKSELPKKYKIIRSRFRNTYETKTENFTCDEAIKLMYEQGFTFMELCAYLELCYCYDFTLSMLASRIMEMSKSDTGEIKEEFEGLTDYLLKGDGSTAETKQEEILKVIYSGKWSNKYTLQNFCNMFNASKMQAGYLLNRIWRVNKQPILGDVREVITEKFKKELAGINKGRLKKDKGVEK